MSETIQPLTGDQCVIFTFDGTEPIELLTVANIAFDSVPLQLVEEGVFYVYVVLASDTISCNYIDITSEGGLPAWLELTQTLSGVAILQGVPAQGDIGQYDITLRATDGGGGEVTQEFTVTVLATSVPDDDPKISDLGESTFLIFVDEEDL